MKLVFALILVVVCSSAAFAQDAEIEKDFEKNKPQYKLEKFSVGEDASSGYDYFFYKDKSNIVKVREIWSRSGNSTHRADDYYYRNGILIALVKYTFNQKYYRTAEKGRNVPLKMVEKLVFNDSKLTAWTNNGKTVPATDDRWQEREKEALEAGKAMLEDYKWLKDNN